MFRLRQFGVILAVFGLFEVGRSKIIDLSHPHGINTIMSLYSAPKFNRTYFEIGTKKRGYFAATGWYSTSEHGGTHLDAPLHFSEGGMSLDKIPLEYLILEGVMIDCAQEAKLNEQYGVSVAKLQAWEEKNGRIPDEAAVLFNYNWSRKFDDELAYKGTDDVKNYMNYKYPHVNFEAAKWLLNNRNLRLIGGDVLSPDPFQINGSHSGLPIHRLYLPDDRLIIENLRDTWKLPARGFRFHAAPVAFEKNTGAQVRAYAMTYESEGNTASTSIPANLWILTITGAISAAIKI